MCSDQENHKQKTSKLAVGPRRKTGSTRGVRTVGPMRKEPLRAGEASDTVKPKSAGEEETYRVWMNMSSAD